MLKPIPQLVQEIRSTVRCVTAQEAQEEILLSGRGVIIDVREAVEVSDRPTPLSVSIPRGVLEMKAATLYPDPHEVIYVHCASGARATLAAEQLVRLGYTQVSIITCDIIAVCDGQLNTKNQEKYNRRK